MTQKPILLALAIGAFWTTAGILNAEAVNSAPACPIGIVCYPAGAHKLHPEPAGLGMQNSGDNLSQRWLHRGSQDRHDEFAIYIGEDYGDGSRALTHPRHHCSVVEIWRGTQSSPSVCVPREAITN